MDFLPFFQQEENREFIQLLKEKDRITLSGIGNISAKVFLIADFFRSSNDSVLVVLNTKEEIKTFLNYMSFWRLSEKVRYLNINEEKKNLSIIDFLWELNTKRGIFVVVRAVIFEKFPNVNTLTQKFLTLKKGNKINNIETFNKLIQMGYELGEDIILKKGEYSRSGGVLNIFPVNSDLPYKIEIGFDTISHIWLYYHEEKRIGDEVDEIDILPIVFEEENKEPFLQIIPDNCYSILDELDDEDGIIENFPKKHIVITSFPKTDEDYYHLRYLSVIKFYNITDFLNDLSEKVINKWKILILSKRGEEIKGIFDEEKISYSTEFSDSGITVMDYTNEEFIPISFQNPNLKIAFITDKEIFSLRKSARNKSLKKLNLEFLSSLKEGDFVVHLTHGIGRFLGIIQREIDDIAREYMEILYAENDKLFVPIDQADKVSKYISSEESEDNEPKLSRLGAQEWKTVTRRLKKETEKIAKELLQLYAVRAEQKGIQYNVDTDVQNQFEEEFPYEETPGQMKAIQDIKEDMESNKPMDRLICGDVGFGKTEVAMRAAFKAIQNKKQVAFISPITILADQHYRTFTRRMAHFGVKTEMLSRFKSAREQTEIIKKLQLGDVDIVIGTHRLIQSDVKFHNLGLVIIDEEQRFGVKQKESLKKLRTEIDILTLTATPIPRTLNLSLNKLRDITIISTPPPGRLPIITEVRKYSEYLIRETILKELDRKGQTYFLHNRVETIDGLCAKLKYLVPEARFIVAHGKLGSGDLEERIIQFKEHKYDVLVSSTIIENGIDLPNANTLIVNNAEMFGLSQLYQLRGRIGRGKKQAYAYFLYHKQKLKAEAKKRLRAIVEASELGAGFQIAMRDLEIRGAGEILGASQHGMINVVGIGHFIRLLNKTIDEIKTGRKYEEEEEKEEFSIEIPVEAYIPNNYITDTKEKISLYQKLSAVDSHDLLKEIKDDVLDEYGDIPKQVSALFSILDIKLLSKQIGLTAIKTENVGTKKKLIVFHLSDKITPPQIINLLNYNDKWKITGNTLKLDIKDLGFRWLQEVKESVKKLF